MKRFYYNYTREKDTFVDFALLVLSMGKIPEVFDFWKLPEKKHSLNLRTQMQHHIAFFHLKHGYIVAEEKLFDEALHQDFFIRTEYFSMIVMIHRGVKNNDWDTIESGKKNIIIQFLKPEIANINCSFKGPKAHPPEEKSPSDNKESPQEPQENVEEELALR